MLLESGCTVLGKGQEVIKMNAGDWNFTRNDETGQVFMTPGVSNYSGSLKVIHYFTCVTGDSAHLM